MRLKPLSFALLGLTALGILKFVLAPLEDGSMERGREGQTLTSRLPKRDSVAESLKFFSRTPSSQQAGKASDRVGGPSRDSGKNDFSSFQEASEIHWKTVPKWGSPFLKTFKDGKIRLPGKDNQERAHEFLSRYGLSLLGVTDEDLRLTREERPDESFGGESRMIFEQRLQGHPVRGSRLVLVFEDESLTRIQNDLFPLQSRSVVASESYNLQTSDEAWENLKERSPENLESATLNGKPGLVFWPTDDKMILAYEYHAYVKGTSQANASAQYVIIVDAQTGQILKMQNQLRS